MSGIRRQKIKQRQRSQKYKTLKEDIKSLMDGQENLRYLSVHSIQNDLTRTFKYQSTPSLSSIRRCMKASGISRRRLSSIVAIKGTGDRGDKMDTFKTIIEQIENDEIMCLDETGFGTHNNAVYGYFPRGRVPIKKKYAKREKISAIVAITAKGMVTCSIQSKAYNKDDFITFLKEKLIPNTPNTVKYLFMDNVAFHHSNIAVKLLEANDIKPVYVPPYTPQCNPIEEVFSMVKREFRKQFHATENFKEAIQHSLKTLSSCDDFSGYYSHMRREIQKMI